MHDLGTMQITGAKSYAGCLVQGKYTAWFAARFEHPCSPRPEDFFHLNSIWDSIHLFCELTVPATSNGDMLNNLIAIILPSMLSHFTNGAWVLQWGFVVSFFLFVKWRKVQARGSICLFSFARSAFTRKLMDDVSFTGMDYQTVKGHNGYLQKT